MTLIAGAYALFALRGPQGLPALKEKWEEVRQLEFENQQLEERIRQKREQVKRLAMESELEIETRKELMQVKPGEKTLILPDAEPETAAPARP